MNVSFYSLVLDNDLSLGRLALLSVFRCCYFPLIFVAGEVGTVQGGGSFVCTRLVGSNGATA